MPYEDIIKIYINKYPNKRIIVYVSSRKKTEDITVNINKHFNSSIANAYHAGLSKDSRECVQREFIEQKCNVIISTIAFGMGIDQIVRCVLCIGCPSTIEEYWQQIGRGGRDGLECETILYFDYGNYIRSKIMINKDKMCLNAVKKNPSSFIYVINQTDAMCLTAVRKRCDALKYVIDQTEEICLIALNKDANTLRYIRNQTDAMCLFAVRQDNNPLLLTANKHISSV